MKNKNSEDQDQKDIESYPSSLELPPIQQQQHHDVDMLMVPHIDPSNPFAFNCEQMCQIVDQKHLDFLEKVGGIEGIAKGLHSNTKSGLVWNEESLSFIRMFDLTNPQTKEKEEEHFYDNSAAFPLSLDSETFIQRRRIFGSNVLPQIEQVSLLELMWQAFQDKTLVKWCLCYDLHAA